MTSENVENEAAGRRSGRAAGTDLAFSVIVNTCPGSRRKGLEGGGGRRTWQGWNAWASGRPALLSAAAPGLERISEVLLKWVADR